METFSRETMLEPWFATGFCESAASFTFSRSGKQLSLYFSVKLPASDRALLDALQAFFAGAGTIYDLDGPASAYFRISRIKELEAVVRHFDAYPLQGRKGVAYKLWRAIYDYKVESRRKPDRDHLEQLASRLSSFLMSG